MSIRERAGCLEIEVYAGRGVDGKKKRLHATVRGTNRAAWREAKRVEGDLLAKIATGRTGRSDVTVGHVWDRWRALESVERSTAYADGLAFDKHVRPVLGDVPLRRLTTEDLDQFYVRLTKGDRRHAPLSAATVRRIHNRLASALVQAERWRWIPKGESPARWASPPAVPEADPASPPTTAVVALLDALGPELRAYVWLVAATGLRRAAACALIRDDLDLDGGVLRSRRSLGMAKGEPYVKGTKTGARHAMALGPETVTRLRDHLTMQDTTAAGFAHTIPDTAYLFSHDDDCARPWRPDWPTHKLRAITLEQKLEPVTLRGLRHWMITEGLDSGASVKAVAGRASHSRASTTLDVYAAFVPASDRDLAESIEGRLGIQPRFSPSSD